MHGGMIMIDKDKARRAFEDYTNRYDVTNKKIWLKVEHTYRVAELCEVISASVGYAGQDDALAWLVGLLHDVGRFEQIRRYLKRESSFP